MMLFSGLRQTIRGLVRRRGFSSLAILTLAVGIGSTTAVYSIADAVLFRPLPFADAERIVRLHSFNVARGFGFSNVSYPNFAEWRAETDVFDSASVFRTLAVDLAGGGTPQRIRVATVDVGFFRVLGTRPVVGRTLLEDDHDPTSELVTVLSEGLWQSRFGGDPTVVGRTVRLDGVPHTVVGVVDETGQWPLEARAWIPVRFLTEPTRWNNHSWQVIARVTPGTTIGEATARVSTLALQASARQPDERDQGWDAAATPLLSLASGDDLGVAFVLLFAAVLAVLLLACLNVANLLLTQGIQRAESYAIRLALGAGRMRVLGGVLSDSLVLALAGGGLGIGLALGARELLAALAPVELPRIDEVGLRLPVIAVGLGLSLVASLVAGVLPAWRVARSDAGTVLRKSGVRGGAPARRTRHALVTAQIAVSLVLLIGAAVLVRTLERTLDVDPGFQTHQVMAFTIALPESRYDGRTSVNLFYDDMIARIEAIPGVRSATATSVIPFGGGGFNLLRVFLPEGAPEPPAGPDHPAQWFEIDPSWFDTLDVRVATGRAFTRADNAEAPATILVNEAMAARLASDGTAVGMRIRSWRDENEYRTVVGVLPDLAYTGLSRRDRPAVYVPRAQSTRRQMGVLVRGIGDPVELVPIIRDRVSSLDADLALDGVLALDQQMRTQLAGPRFITRVLGLFGVVSLLLAATGVYGLTAFAVARRTHEIGIRMALGASHRRVRALIVRQTAPVLLVGTLIGVGVAAAIARVAASQILGFAVVDVLTFGTATALLLSVALVASYLPARRASRIDPWDALREE